MKRSLFRRLAMMALFGIAWLAALTPAPASATIGAETFSAVGSGCC